MECGYHGLADFTHLALTGVPVRDGRLGATPHVDGIGHPDVRVEATMRGEKVPVRPKVPLRVFERWMDE